MPAKHIPEIPHQKNFFSIHGCESLNSLLDCIGLGHGGGGGSRTRVRKYSTIASTYVSFVLILHRKTPKGRINPALSRNCFALLPPGKEVGLSCLNDVLI